VILSDKKNKSIRHYVDSNIVLALVVVSVITCLVWLNISVERQKLTLIEQSLTGYMGYLKNMIFSSTYDSLKKGNMKLFTDMLEEIGGYEYVSEFSLVNSEGLIRYSSDNNLVNERDSRVIGLTDSLQVYDFDNITYYFPVTTVRYCTRCHTEWPEDSIKSYYKVALSRSALISIANFSNNTYFMVIFSGMIMAVFVYMFFYMIRKKISEDSALESERKYRSLFENIMDVQYSTDMRGNLTLISPSGVRLLGYESEEETIKYGLGQSMFFDIDERREFLRTLATYGEVQNYEIRLRKKDNTPFVVEMNTKIIYDKHKNPVSVDGVFRDITYRKEYEKQLKLMAIVFDTAVESIIITNNKGVVDKVNPAFTEITGYKPQEIIGRTPRVIRSDVHPESFYIGLHKELFKTGRWAGEIWNRKANGEIYPEWLSVTVIRDEKGKITHYVHLGHDITEQKRSEEQLKHQAYHDPLTGLPNRELLRDRLEMALAYCSRHTKKLAIIFIDMDNFKYVNDTAGHHVGDLFLQEISSILKSACRDEDTVARMGGDEFVILLPDVENDKSAVNVAKRIFESFSEPIVINGHSLMPGASIGISYYPDDGETCTSLLRAADMAMYFAKEQGKGHYVNYSPHMDTSSVDRVGIEADIRKALKRKEFIMYYQPVVSLTDGCIKGFESLIRWQRADGSITMPGDFIEVAEQSPIILKIGEFVLEETCSMMKRIADLGYGHLSFSVNVSSKQFQNSAFPEKVKKAVKKAGIQAHKLILEITENTVVSDVKTAIETMRTIKSNGVRISLDDFGTGYSSLAYLKEFPISILKIDRTFTREIVESQGEQHITDAIVSLAKSFELLVIAEGVENVQQIEYLRNIKCDFIQGFYFARPMPEEDVIELIQSGRMLDV